MSIQICDLSIKGYKSIRNLQSFEPGSVNVLIGPNGAGKSNLISFFRLLSWLLSGSGGELQRFVGIAGGANAILYDGAGTTSAIEAGITLRTEAGDNEYFFRLAHAAEDTLIFSEEKYRFSSKDFSAKAGWRQFGAGHSESKLVRAGEDNQTARVVLSLLRNCVVYQFHNTSPTSRMRSKWSIDDNRWLKEDGANLASFLLRLKDKERAYYVRIVETLRLILPFFADFELEPDYDSVLLKWTEKETDMVFGASQASDGMLRTMALVTLLLQPPKDLPGVLILDEPELGLHPMAIEIVSGLIQNASSRSQIFIATQSPGFVEMFGPQEIVVVERCRRESTYRRLDEERLGEWLEEYTLAELWNKNVLGGRPMG